MSERQDKTFEPTPRRLQKAREEGNVFRSKEIVSVGTIFAGAGTIAIGLPYAFSTLETLTSQIFLNASSTVLTPRIIPAILTDLGIKVVLILAPFFLMVMTTGFGLSVLQSGWNITLKPLAPKGNRINPLEGLKRIFSSRGLFEFFKSFMKVVLVGPLAYTVIANHLPEILLLHTLPIQEILQAAGKWIAILLGQILLALLVLSGIDFFFERWRHRQDLMMSHHEVKEEIKEQEGSPQVKGKRRQLARELLRRPRLDHAVLKSDVVITNPTHYAVALRYDPQEAEAPRVLAKGIRKRALRIKELAREHGIPMIENRPLARTLYENVQEEREISTDLYAAVAAILAEIYRRRRR